jgi:hypothetical protein
MKQYFATETVADEWANLKQYGPVFENNLRPFANSSSPQVYPRIEAIIEA